MGFHMHLVNSTCILIANCFYPRPKLCISGKSTATDRKVARTERRTVAGGLNKDQTMGNLKEKKRNSKKEKPLY
jgi:hypothetical protein